MLKISDRLLVPAATEWSGLGVRCHVTALGEADLSAGVWSGLGVR